MKKMVLWVVVLCLVGSAWAGSIIQEQGSSVSALLMGADNGGTNTSILLAQGQQNANWQQSATQNSQNIFTGEVVTGHNGAGVVNLSTGNMQGQLVGNGGIIQGQGSTVNLGTVASNNAAAAGCYASALNQSATGPGKIAVGGQIVAVFSLSAVSSVPCHSTGMAANCVEVEQCQSSAVTGGCQSTPTPCP